MPELKLEMDALCDIPFCRYTAMYRNFAMGFIRRETLNNPSYLLAECRHHLKKTSNRIQRMNLQDMHCTFFFQLLIRPGPVGITLLTWSIATHQ